MAEVLKQELGLNDVALVPGGRGEFSVWVAETMVVQKNGLDFPEEQQVLTAVRAALDT